MRVQEILQEEQLDEGLIGSVVKAIWSLGFFGAAVKMQIDSHPENIIPALVTLSIGWELLNVLGKKIGLSGSSIVDDIRDGVSQLKDKLLGGKFSDEEIDVIVKRMNAYIRGAKFQAAFVDDPDFVRDYLKLIDDFEKEFTSAVKTKKKSTVDSAVDNLNTRLSKLVDKYDVEIN